MSLIEGPLEEKFMKLVRFTFYSLLLSDSKLISPPIHILFAIFY